MYNVVLELCNNSFDLIVSIIYKKYGRGGDLLRAHLMMCDTHNISSDEKFVHVGELFNVSPHSSSNTPKYIYTSNLGT